MGFSGGLSKENRSRHSLNSGANYQVFLAGSIAKPTETPVVQGLKRIMPHHCIAGPIEVQSATTQQIANGGLSCGLAGGRRRYRDTHGPISRILTPA